MADVVFIAQPPAEVACYNGGSAKTVLQVKAPANQRVKIREWGIFFDGTNVTAEPVIVDLIRQSSAGTMSSITLNKVITVNETIQSTAQHTATSEPVTAAVIDTVEVHPQSGYEKTYAYSHEPYINGGEYVGIVVTAAAAVNCRVKMICEE